MSNAAAINEGVSWGRVILVRTLWGRRQTLSGFGERSVDTAKAGAGQNVKERIHCVGMEKQ